MIIFSPPEEKAIRAVLIKRNKRIANKLLKGFALILAICIAYGVIRSVASKYYTLNEIFSDYIFAVLLCLSIFVLVIALLLINCPIRQKSINNNGGYKTVFEKDCIKVIFPDEPEIIVGHNEIDSVEEYDICYIVHIRNNTDEIICSKSAFIKGDENKLRKYFARIDFAVKVRTDKKIYFSLVKKMDKSIRAGMVSILLSLLCIVVAYPLIWLGLSVLLKIVPNILLELFKTLWDFALIIKILIGVLFVPIGVLLTIISGVSLLAVVGMPLFYAVISLQCVVVQFRRNNKFIGYLAVFLNLFAFLAIIVAFLIVMGLI